MGKRIVLCSDGTGNTGGKLRGTNVYRLYRALVRSPDQIAFYDDGVGTESWKPLKLFSGATGFGFSRNVRDLYQFLVNTYEPGDGIYMFGFSRGAYTVRALSGFVHRCGILTREGRDHHRVQRRDIRHAARCLNGQLRALGNLDRADNQAAADEMRSHLGVHHPVPIRMLGVWDTVSAMGAPHYALASLFERFSPFRFRNHRLAGSVEHAFHALALDDERRTFHPEMWRERDARPGQVIEQVWFAGVHANVGGGYMQDELALIPLDWMITRAQSLGLEFEAGELARIRAGGDVHGKLYDSRRGLAAYYRYTPRDVAQITGEFGAGPAMVHHSVLERARHFTRGYAPGNLPAGIRVVGTAAEPGPAGRARISRISRRLQETDGQRLAGLTLAKPWIRTRKLAQRLSLVSLLLLVLAYLRFRSAGAGAAASGELQQQVDRALALLPAWLTGFLDRFGEFLLTVPGAVLAALAAGSLLASWPLRWRVERLHQQAWAPLRNHGSTQAPDRPSQEP